MRTRSASDTDLSPLAPPVAPRVSAVADALIGSEILKIATDIRRLVADGHRICNLTVGDFSPAEFRIPSSLEHDIREAYAAGETNYPPSDGMLILRRAVCDFYKEWLNLSYDLDAVLVTGGSRPGIYTVYRAIVDPGDRVVYPVPSWNNNHYCHLMGAEGRPVVCDQEGAFLPTRSLLEKEIKGARLLAVNSPLNPTGTAFRKETLEEICDLVLEENARRGPEERPLFFMYDQVYWMLTFGGTEHYNPVSLRPELAPYTIFVDGISKPFAATGIRVGWTVGPHDITARMASILGHMGAWAPRAEQIATAKLLANAHVIREFHHTMKAGIQKRLDLLYTGLIGLRREGFSVDAIAPMGAIYLSARFALAGRRTPEGATLRTNEDIRKYILQKAGVAIVPFQAFGSLAEDGWFRLSVGAVSVDDITAAFPRLRAAIEQLA